MLTLFNLTSFPTANLENTEDFENASNILNLVLGFTKWDLTLFTKTTVSMIDSGTFENPPPTYP
jgi:hypothetical protein